MSPGAGFAAVPTLPADALSDITTVNDGAVTVVVMVVNELVVPEVGAIVITEGATETSRMIVSASFAVPGMVNVT